MRQPSPFVPMKVNEEQNSAIPPAETGNITLSAEDFTQEVTANGYMIFYKNHPIGGAGVGPRSKPLHWRHARQNVKDFAANAQDSINAILQGRGEKRFLDSIANIDAALVEGGQ